MREPVADAAIRIDRREVPPRSDSTQPPARHRALNVLLAVPTLDVGADAAAVMDTVRILRDAGHGAVVTARSGRRVDELAELGAHFVPLDMRSRNPAIMLANVPRLVRLMRRHRCDIVHAHGRAAAWSGYAAARIAGRPFVTTWHKASASRTASSGSTTA